MNFLPVYLTKFLNIMQPPAVADWILPHLDTFDLNKAQAK